MPVAKILVLHVTPPCLNVQSERPIGVATTTLASDVVFVFPVRDGESGTRLRFNRPCVHDRLKWRRPDESRDANGDLLLLGSPFLGRAGDALVVGCVHHLRTTVTSFFVLVVTRMRGKAQAPPNPFLRTK